MLWRAREPIQRLNIVTQTVKLFSLFFPVVIALLLRWICAIEMYIVVTQSTSRYFTTSIRACFNHIYEIDDMNAKNDSEINEKNGLKKKGQQVGVREKGGRHNMKLKSNRNKENSNFHVIRGSSTIELMNRSRRWKRMSALNIQRENELICWRSKFTFWGGTRGTPCHERMKTHVQCSCSRKFLFFSVNQIVFVDVVN